MSLRREQNAHIKVRMRTMFISPKPFPGTGDLSTLDRWDVFSRPIVSRDLWFRQSTHDVPMLLEVLRDTASALRSRGIEVATGIGDPVPEPRLDQLEALHDVRLPHDLRSIYLTIGDGLHLSWEHGDTGGMLDIQPAADLMEVAKRFRVNVAEFADDPRSMDMCVDPPHRSRAFEIWESMRHWTPFMEEPNGDGFCIRPDGAVVYDQHDWFDGFGDVATTNGLVAGRSLLDFIQQWSRFFFTPPTSLWWGEFGKRGSIDWEPALFHPDFTRP